MHGLEDHGNDNTIAKASRAASKLRYSSVPSVKQLFDTKSEYVDDPIEVTRAPPVETNPVASVGSALPDRPRVKSEYSSSDFNNAALPIHRPHALTSPQESTPVKYYSNEWRSRRSTWLEDGKSELDEISPSSNSNTILNSTSIRSRKERPLSKSVSFPSIALLREAAYNKDRSSQIQHVSAKSYVTLIRRFIRVLILLLVILVAACICYMSLRGFINSCLAEILNLNAPRRDIRPWMKTFNWDILNDLREVDLRDAHASLHTPAKKHY